MNATAQQSDEIFFPTQHGLSVDNTNLTPRRVARSKMRSRFLLNSRYHG